MNLFVSVIPKKRRILITSRRVDRMNPSGGCVLGYRTCHLAFLAKPRVIRVNNSASLEACYAGSRHAKLDTRLAELPRSGRLSKTSKHEQVDIPAGRGRRHQNGSLAPVSAPVERRPLLPWLSAV
jgi:hypothetical protein